MLCIDSPQVKKRVREVHAALARAAPEQSVIISGIFKALLQPSLLPPSSLLPTDGQE